MPNFSSATIMGHMCRDVEMRQAGDYNIASFSIAVTKKIKDKETVSYFDCKAWDRQAAFVEQYFKKGDAILVQGELTQETWDDKNTGQKRSKIVVTVDRATFAGGGGRSGKSGYRADDRGGNSNNDREDNRRGGGRYQSNDGGSEQLQGAGQDFVPF